MALTVSKSYYGSQSFNDVIRPFFILAINSELNKENELAFVEAALGRTCKQVIGSYNNVQDVSYLVPVNSKDEFSYDVWLDVRRLADKFNQESVLFVDSARTAYLYFLADKNTSRIGKFKRITAAEAIESGNWTLDQSQFWGVTEAHSTEGSTPSRHHS